jgi:phosphatidylglycerophosphate synthase
VSFWAGYKSSLKPLEVEEPIDVWVHRPLAYLLARAAYPTPVSPNAITFMSIVFGLAAGASLVGAFPHHMQIGGACIFLSAVFDCADGQLARMRKTSSAFGRMLDGAADLVVACAAVGGGIWVVFTKYQQPLWLGATALALSIVTAVTGSFHTAMYDHYKNVFLRFTSETYKEGEDYQAAIDRYRQRSGRESLGAKLAWPIYVFYVKSQMNYVHAFDPYTSARLSLFPPYSRDGAAIYRRHAGGLMRLWRGFFGFGSLVFGLALATALNVLEWYMLARLLLLNSLFYGYMRPRQRRASAAAFRELGLALPDQAREP